MKKNEKGQIIVILAVALVAVLGITALAVDGSMIYKERRDIQTTADSSSLAAATTASASTTCATAASNAVTAAINYASTNEGITLVNNSTSPNRVEVACNSDNTKLTIKVTITKTSNTTFAKMVARNQLTNTVSATSQVTLGGSKFAGGSGVVAMDTGSCTSTNGLYVSGTSIIQTVGASIFTNNCINLTGDGKVIAYGGTNQYYSALNMSGGGAMRALNDTNPSATPTNTGINMSLPQTSQPVAYQASKATSRITNLSIPAMVAQTCAGLDDKGPLNQGWADHIVTVPSGKYDSISVNIGALFPEGSIYCIKDGGSVTLKAYEMTANKTIWYFMGSGSFIKEGNYNIYMDNSSVYIQNGNFIIRNSANIIAHNITVYIKKGNFLLTGNVPAVMTAPDCDNSSCGVGPAIKGVLLLMDPSNTLVGSIYNPTSGEIWVDGSSSLTMEGTIFAPGSQVLIKGNSGVTTLESQFIAKDIQVEGSSTLKLDLTNANIYQTSGGGGIELLK